MSIAKYFLTKPCSIHFVYPQLVTAKFKLIYVMKEKINICFSCPLNN
jgi:hypothetical protein